MNYTVVSVVSILLVFSYPLFVDTLPTDLPPCDEIDKLIPDPQNCSRFYQCDHTGWVNLNCSEGLYFNPDTLQCDYNEQVDCQPSNEIEAIELPPCDQLDDLTADPTNCSRFYECTLGGWVRLSCQRGLYFNPRTNSCDYPENVDCRNPSAVKLTEVCDELDKLIPDPKNCSRFYECVLSVWTRLDCPAGLYFNPDTLECDYPENVDCHISTNVLKVTEVCDELDELIPDPKNCSRFYECVLSVWTRLDCPAGLYFNPNTLQCDYPENVDCHISNIFKAIGSEECGNLLLNKLKPDPTNCSQFIQCAPQGLVTLPCARGLLFNPITLQCDYPENVDCEIETDFSEFED